MSWKAGKNFDDSIKLEDIKHLMGVYSDKTVSDIENPKALVLNLTQIPDSFDLRQAWPQCTSINQIRDQGSCGSCWAMAVVETITDRICIASQGKQHVEISAEDLLSCCTACGDGCDGGYIDRAWNYYINTGIVSGGGYDSHKGCRPYTIAACEHHMTGQLPACSKTSEPTPSCVKHCDSGYNHTYNVDKHYGISMYEFTNENNRLQSDIISNGPVVASFQVWEDFLTYKYGVYHHMIGKSVGAHAVKIIGWGVENGVDYWLAANSWNREWGDNGFFKIRRGRNDCQFEENIITGLPKL